MLTVAQQLKADYLAAKAARKPAPAKRSDTPKIPAYTVTNRAPRIPGPGDVVEIILKRIGYTNTESCGCAAFKAKMNVWGWIGCVLHREEIVRWFAAKVCEAGRPLDDESLWGLVKAALEEMSRAKA